MRIISPDSKSGAYTNSAILAKMVEVIGFEPITSWFKARRSAEIELYLYGGHYRNSTCDFRVTKAAL